MRRWILYGVGALIVLAVLGSALGGGNKPPTASATPTQIAAATTPSVTPTAIAATPTATPEPTATPTPEPIPTPEPTFKTLSFSGRGNKIIKIAGLPDELLIAKATHKGTENFVIWTLDNSGSEAELLVNTIGNYTGSTLVGEERTNPDVAAIKIEADGTWTLAIKDFSTARRWDSSSGALTGKGDDVVLMFPQASGLFVATFKNTGDENFVIWAYSTTVGQDLVVNEIGPYSGDGTLPDGTFLLSIEAVGNWSVTPS